jgi:hypothetical protein
MTNKERVGSGLNYLETATKLPGSISFCHGFGPGSYGTGTYIDQNSPKILEQLCDQLSELALEKDLKVFYSSIKLIQC